MITPYELADTAIKILGGALITAVASYVITRNQHRHDQRQKEIAQRRIVLDRVAAELAAYYSAPTVAQHVLYLHSQGRLREENLYEMVEQLIQGHDRLASAIYSASLLGDHRLMKALDTYWDEATAVYMAVRKQPEIDLKKVGEHLKALSLRSAVVRDRLGAAYRDVGILAGLPTSAGQEV